MTSSGMGFTGTPMRIVILPAILACLVTLAFYLARAFGYILRVRRIYFGSLEDIFYSSPTFTASIKTIHIKFHIPRRSDPYWARISVDGCEYADKECSVTLDNASATLWFFPVFFGFTAGPWVTTILDSFSTRVFDSKRIPRWVDLLRGNIIYTILDGDTIRLHSLQTRIFLDNSMTGSTEGYDGEVEKPGVKCGEEHDEARVRLSSSQWHILNLRQRMYNFGELEAELRRSWVEDRGSLVLISEGGRWIKLAHMPHEAERYNKLSTFRQILHGVASFPSNIIKIVGDPLYTVNVHTTRLDITFEKFKLRDAELFKDASTKLKRAYKTYDQQSPGVFKDTAWDMFVDGVVAASNS